MPSVCFISTHVIPGGFGDRGVLKALALVVHIQGRSLWFLSPPSHPDILLHPGCLLGVCLWPEGTVKSLHDLPSFGLFVSCVTGSYCFFLNTFLLETNPLVCRLASWSPVCHQHQNTLGSPAGGWNIPILAASMYVSTPVSQFIPALFCPCFLCIHISILYLWVSSSAL